MSGIRKKNTDQQQYQTGIVQKDAALKLLKDNGFRITKQRRLLIDIIFSQECTCCKELYFLALKKDPGIGTATIYRTIDALEQAGALKRKNAYQICCREPVEIKKCKVELDDNSTLELDYLSIKNYIEQGLSHSRSTDKKNKKITLMPEE